MKQTFGMSMSGDLKAASKGISRPQFIMLFSNKEQFESHVIQLEQIFPGVPSIGCIGMSYDTRMVEKGVGLIAFSDGVSVWNRMSEMSTAQRKIPSVSTCAAEMTPAYLQRSTVF